MSWHKTVLSTLFVGLGVILSAALAGNAMAQVPIRPEPPTGSGSKTTSKPVKKEPCWEVAGISKAVMQQRRSIAQQARGEEEAVCANASLSMQQKRVQLQQIHQRERQEIDGIITPAQQEAMKSCQEQRQSGHGGGHAGGGHGGPCGEMSSGHKTTLPHDEDEVPPNDTAHPN